MSGGCLSTKEKGIIVGMDHSEMLQYSIAKELGIPRSTIEYVLKKFRDHRTVVTCNAIHQCSKMTEQGRKKLGCILTQNRHIPLASIIEKMNKKVCACTLREEIKRIGFGNVVATKKPFLIKKQKVDRLAFAQKYQAWSLSDWMNVIWTHKSSFEIGKNSQQMKVWWRPNKLYSSNCLEPTFKSRRISIMIWGAFTGYKNCSILVIPYDRQTSANFVYIVYEDRLSGFYFMHNDPQSLHLMEDGAPVHCSTLSKQWREAHKMTKIIWLANLSDLNPIKNLWMIVKDHVQNETQPNNKEEMIKSIERA